MAVFIAPPIDINEIDDLDKAKEYLADLNKKIRFLSTSIDEDNFSSESYKEFYKNDTDAMAVTIDTEKLDIESENYTTETLARLKQTESEIDLLVSKGDVTNQINISTDAIEISGNHLIVSSDNFNLDKDGNLTMKGTINAKSGYFGNYQIATDSSGKQYLSDSNGTIYAADLSGTNIDAQSLVMSTDRDISGCSVDFTNCKVKSTLKSYFGWFVHNDNAYIGGTLYADAVSGDDLVCKGKIYCYDYWSNDEGIAYSDRRLKENIKAIDGKEALEFLMKLRPVKFNYKGFEDVHYGFIAQEILAMGDPYGIVRTDESGYYALNYNSFTALITAAMKYQKEEMEALDVDL